MGKFNSKEKAQIQIFLTSSRNKKLDKLHQEAQLNERLECLDDARLSNDSRSKLSFLFVA